MNKKVCSLCPDCGYPTLIGTGKTPLDKGPEPLVCLTCGTMLKDGKEWIEVA